jgi:anti-sigma B factor antagonist
VDLQPVSANPCTTRLRQAGDTAILDLAGEIDAFADETLDAAYAAAAAGQPHRLLLNFTCVDYINSTGIALIVAILAQTRRDHIVLLACCLTEHYQEMFRITRLADFIAVFADEESALHAAGAHDPGVHP